MLDTGVNDWEAKALRLLGLALLVMCAAWLGIATRPVGFLATIWPANAVLLGLFILYPRLATPGGWLAALVGYVAADLLMGGGWQLALRLSLVNLVFVACGLLLARLTPKRLRSLDSHAGLLALLLICLLAACCSALAAVLLGHWTQPSLYANAWDAASSWFSADLLNAVLVLPVMLSAPGFFSRLFDTRPGRGRDDLWEFAPVVTLLVAMMICIGMGGMGALGVIVTALLWCALSYSLFVTALLTLMTCVWLLVAVNMGLLPLLETHDDAARTLALRLGVILFAIGPLLAASIAQARSRYRQAPASDA